MSVSDSLNASRLAHARYRARANHPQHRRDKATLQSLIQEALTPRQDAETLDPEHEDPAWLEDQAANKGQSSAQMLAFYERYLVTP